MLLKFVLLLEIIIVFANIKLIKMQHIKTSKKYKKQYINSMMNFLKEHEIVTFVSSHQSDPKKTVCCICKDYFHACDTDFLTPVSYS